MEIIKKPRNLKEQADFENAKAQAEKNKANLDYVAMMADIDIPTEEEGGE